MIANPHWLLSYRDLPIPATGIYG